MKYETVIVECSYCGDDIERDIRAFKRKVNFECLRCKGKRKKSYFKKRYERMAALLKKSI